MFPGVPDKARQICQLLDQILLPYYIETLVFGQSVSKQAETINNIYISGNGKIKVNLKI